MAELHNKLECGDKISLARLIPDDETGLQPQHGWQRQGRLTPLLKPQHSSQWWRWCYKRLGQCLIVILVAWLGVSGWGMPSMAADSYSLEELERIGNQAFAATQAGDFTTAERYWTEMLETFPDNPAAWSNRGNVRVSQHQLTAAIADYNRAIELAPEAPDPYLNRGTAWEGLGQWEQAISDYNQVLEIDPTDAAAYNNRGNAEGGLGDWQSAIADYRRATELAPDYAFAFVNYAIALYQVGRTDEALRNLRNLVRKYPNFADARAALTAALWVNGKRGEAESQWVAVSGLDRRYKDLDWVKEVRRWPPEMVAALDSFLNLQRQPS